MWAIARERDRLPSSFRFFDLPNPSATYSYALGETSVLPTIGHSRSMGSATVHLMRLRTKWVLISIAIGFLNAVVLLVFQGALFVSIPPSLDVIADVIFWPVTVCEHLLGPGPSLGPPNEHPHEGTPVQMFAAAIGIAVSWMFWSSLTFLVIHIRTNRRNRALRVRH
jgi:hypothetical protein